MDLHGNGFILYHIFILAEITFQLFICFDVDLLQETIA